MLIAIDYDFTYTADPDFWDDFFSLARLQEHECICITGREQPPGPDERQPPMRVLCSPDRYKSVTAAAAGLSVDVWIDDAPGSIEGGRMLEWECGEE